MQYKGYEIQLRKEDNSYIIRNAEGRVIETVESLREAWAEVDSLTDEK